MTKRKLSYLQGTDAAKYTLPAEDHRLNHAGLWTPDATAGTPALSTRSGFVPGPGNPGAVFSGAGGVTINPFQFVLWGTVTTTSGVYEGVSDAVEFLPITAASSTEFRRGRIVVRVYDQLAAAAKDDWGLEVIYGPAAATAGAAQLPALPANAFQVREFSVSNTGVIVTGGYVPWVGSRTGITPMSDPNDATPGGFVGQYRDHPTRSLERWDGNAWRTMFHQLGATNRQPVQPWLAAGWSPGGDGATYEVKNGWGNLSVHLVRASGGTYPAATAILTLPATMTYTNGLVVPARPTQMQWPAGLKFGGILGEFKVAPSGVVSMGLAVEQGSGIVATASFPVGNP